MSAAIVSLHHETPMTTSLAIAEGVQMEHKTIIQLVRKYVDDLSEWGGVAFEMRPFDTDGGKQWRELAYLNEPQATLLMTFMRNSPVVIEFKKALVRAFFELRDRVQGTPMNMNHQADILVATDRTFGAWLRLGNKLRLGHGKSVVLANEKTLSVTGINVMAEAGYEPVLAVAENLSSAVYFTLAWLAGDLDYPLVCCQSTDLYQAYCVWCEDQAEPWPLAQSVFLHDINHLPGLRKCRKRIRKGDRVVIARLLMPDADKSQGDMTATDWLSRQVLAFKAALGIQA